MKAIFLDRDGVINHLIYNNKTACYESPHQPEDFHLLPSVMEEIKSFQDDPRGQDYSFFLITNQPSFAKEKTSLESILEIQQSLRLLFFKHHIHIREFYCCYHHPEGTRPFWSKECLCRKPKSLFLDLANLSCALDWPNSWFIGDQDSDIFCGQRRGMKTILIEQEHSSHKRGKSSPTALAKHLPEALQCILKT